MDTRVEKFRRTRGAILKLLANEHPGGVDSKVLSALLAELGFELADGECEGHLAYLDEKGFARVDKKKAAGIEIKIASITAAGIDLLDGLIEDVGVDVRF